MTEARLGVTICNILENAPAAQARDTSAAAEDKFYPIGRMDINFQLKLDSIINGDKF